MLKRIQNKIFSYRLCKISKLENICDTLSHNFIWGVGNSGTHLLYDILACSKFFSYLGILPPRKKGLFSSKPYPLKLAPIEGVNYFFDDKLPYLKKDGGMIFDHFLSSKNISKSNFNFIKARYSNINKLSSCYIKNLNPSHKQFVLDKSTNYSFMINPIKKIFPNSKHILLLRDPRSIFLSMVNRKIKKSEYQNENNQDIDFSDYFTFKNKKKMNVLPMDNVIIQICWLIDSFFSIYKKYDRDILIIYFEELINDTEGTIRKALSHFGIEEKKINFLENFYNKIDKNKINNKKIDSLSSFNIQKRILKDLNKLSQEIGYDANKLSTFSKDRRKLKNMKDYKISKKFVNSFF